MEGFIKSNLFFRYLLEQEETPHAFARRSGIPCQTIYRILNGQKPRRSTVVRICRATGKKLRPRDFGYL